jgi:hypothetical protein
MRAIGNFLWFILGGALMGLAWWHLRAPRFPASPASNRGLQ